MSALPDWLLAWFNSPWLPLILCLGAFSDAFIGVSLFVLGEFFFVAGGYLVAQSAQWWIVPLIWAAALLGDILSYFVGKRYGKQIVHKYIRPKAKRRLHYRRAYRLMLKRGGTAIFIARITGPLSKFMPLLAGSMKLPFHSVFWASLWGIIIGTAQFFIIGYALAKGSDYWDHFWNLFSG